MGRISRRFDPLPESRLLLREFLLQVAQGDVAVAQEFFQELLLAEGFAQLLLLGQDDRSASPDQRGEPLLEVRVAFSGQDVDSQEVGAECSGDRIRAAHLGVIARLDEENGRSG